MLKELYTAALGMIPQQTRLEITSNNIANANTTGFKRVGVFEQSLIDARANLMNVRGDAEQEDPPTQTFTDFTAGSLQKTDNPLDLGMLDSGFFVLQNQDGNDVYTRGGHFTIDDTGRLVSSDGGVLMGEKGPIIVTQAQQPGSLFSDNKTNSISISQSGEVFADSIYVGTINVVDIQNPQTLLRVGNTEFQPMDDTIVENRLPETLRIKQGFLESSNVNIISEMVALIQLQRSFEMGQKVITTNDSTLDRSIDISRFGS